MRFDGLADVDKINQRFLFVFHWSRSMAEANMTNNFLVGQSFVKMKSNFKFRTGFWCQSTDLIMLQPIFHGEMRVQVDRRNFWPKFYFQPKSIFIFQMFYVIEMTMEGKNNESWVLRTHICIKYTRWFIFHSSETPLN